MEIVLFAHLYTMPYPVANDILQEPLRPVCLGVFPQRVAPLSPWLQPHPPAEGMEGPSEVVSPDSLTNPISSLLGIIIGGKQDFIQARLYRYDPFLFGLGGQHSNPMSTPIDPFPGQTPCLAPT